MVNELAREGKRALLEVIVAVGRQFSNVAWALRRIEIVYHERRAAPDAAKATLLRGDVKTI